MLEYLGSGEYLLKIGDKEVKVNLTELNDIKDIIEKEITYLKRFD